VAAAQAEGLSVRQAAELCGWSVGWVSTRYAELRGSVNGVPVDLAGTSHG
jgi:DNA-directed RNA polymerase specialized sigma24 family protein